MKARRVASFEQWSEAGYRIKKGAKHIQRTKDGTPMFAEDQVYRPIQRSSHYEGYMDSPDRYSDYEMDCLGDPWGNF